MSEPKQMQKPIKTSCSMLLASTSKSKKPFNGKMGVPLFYDNILIGLFLD